MWKKSEEGSTSQLLRLCAGYFIFYVITGVSVKYFLGPDVGMTDMEYLIYSTAGGNAICMAVVLWKRWYKLQSNNRIQVGPLSIPSELFYIIPSGVCTAVVIPTTTLMYTLPISVMVAMVIMRGAVIVISRAVDEVQIRQGILKKKLYREENIAVVFALSAVASKLFLDSGPAGFDFLGNPAAVAILGSYIVAYSLRIYIMNYFKNTRPKGVKYDNNGFFAVEQIAATITLGLAVLIFYYSGSSAPQVLQMNGAISDPKPLWGWAVLSGVAYGIVAFFSVFIFMFKGRSATFAGLVNRLTSLVAGTASTLIIALFFAGKLPKYQDWVSLALILVAVAFLSIAERKRAAELSVRLEGNVEGSGNSIAVGAARLR
jgi:hypothetical protein